MAKLVQSVMHCPCGRETILANGLCASCYNLKRQDAEYFGGLREAVLERDGYRCRVCDAPGGRKREMIVHHRVSGKSVLALMISLCPGCHAKVHRTKAVLAAMPPLLLKLWREQHPQGHEQVQLDFTSTSPRRSLRQKPFLFSGRRRTRMDSAVEYLPTMQRRFRTISPNQRFLCVEEVLQFKSFNS